jgi:hypothetical protein
MIFAGFKSRCVMRSACAAGHAIGDLRGEIEQLLEWKRTLLEYRGQRLARDQFADDVERSFGGADIEHAHDVGMVPRRGEAGFLFETSLAAGVSGDCRRQNFQRAIAAQARVARDTPRPWRPRQEAR